MKKNDALSTRETVEKFAAGQKGKRRGLFIAIILFICLLAGGFVIAGKLKGPDQTVRYSTQLLEKGNLEITVNATGNLEATNQVEVGSELSGIVKTMNADYNDAVQAGMALASLDDTKYKAAVTKSQAEVASARANYAEAIAVRKANQKTVDRYRKTRDLTKGKLPSKETLEQAEADLEKSAAAVKAAAAAIEIAKATLKSNETDLKKTIIYAPISGIVLSRDVEPGQTVAASLSAPVLFVLAEDLRRMELQVDVDEADVGMVKEGQFAFFTVDAYPDKTFTAQITQVRYGAETTDGVVTYKTVMSVENPDLLLRPGMTATANIIVQKVENSFLVPNSALRFTPDNGSGKNKAKRGLLGSLMPGPHRRQTSKKDMAAPEGESNGQKAKSKVWVLKDNHPTPVVVEKIATDGVHTAVSGDQLQPGMEIIINQLTIQG